MLETMLSLKNGSAPSNDMLKGIATITAYTGSPPARYIHAQVVIADTLYVFGGYSGTWNNELWAYDITTKVWTQKASAPAGGTVQSPCIFTDGVKLYVIDTFDGTGTTFYSYTPEPTHGLPIVKPPQDRQQPVASTPQ